MTVAATTTSQPDADSLLRELARANPAMLLRLADETREDPLKDKAYQQTPIGALVAKFLDELEYTNRRPKTLINREATLAHFAIAHPYLEPHELTAQVCKEFLQNRWRAASTNTKSYHTSSVRTFIQWAADNGHIPHDFSRRLPMPKPDPTTRRARDIDEIRKLIVSQPSRRDRLALQLLYWCALRKGELQRVQWRDINIANRLLWVQGKGGHNTEQSIDERLALPLERYVQDENPLANHFLLYPLKTGRRGRWPLYTTEVIWEDKARPLGDSGMQVWWRRCLRNASLDQFPMHEIRHSAATHFYEATGDLLATQALLRHASAATTERVYIHTARAQRVALLQRKMPDPLAVLRTSNDPDGDR